MTEDWKPKTGDRVRVITHSTVTGRLVNVRQGVVSSATGKYAYVRGASDKFHIGGPGPWRQWRPRRGGGSMMSSRIEPLKPEDADLPTDGMGGSRFARQIIADKREAEFPR